MSDDVLIKLFEHNNWANQQIIQVCYALRDEQLDTQPQSAAKGSIRDTLTHLVTSQRGYLALLTLPVDARPSTPLTFAQLQESSKASGEGLLAFINDKLGKTPKARLQTRDDFYVEPWVILVQIINHATEHREQIKSMLSALGVTPPGLDGWDYGELAGAMVPMSK